MVEPRLSQIEAQTPVENVGDMGLGKNNRKTAAETLTNQSAQRRLLKSRDEAWSHFPMRLLLTSLF